MQRRTDNGAILAGDAVAASTPGVDDQRSLPKSGRRKMNLLGGSLSNRPDKNSRTGTGTGVHIDRALGSHLDHCAANGDSHAVPATGQEASQGRDVPGER